MIVIFAGPTISHDEIQQHLDCVCLPPVCHGDLIKLMPSKPTAIGIIDGYFEGAPSVWHKEILYAMDQGARVFGSSSMGALRAAELHPFGMQGIGQIFQWYRDDVIAEDDEVAVLHGPAEAGYAVASEPMVSVRATLDKAVEQDILDKQQCDALTVIAKQIFYKNRTWRSVLQAAGDLFSDQQALDQFSQWLIDNRVDLKKNDAVQMLQAMDRNKETFGAGFETDFHFEWTHVWDTAYASLGGDQPGEDQLSADDALVLEQLRLDPVTYQRYSDRALLVWVCNNRVETGRSADYPEQVLKRFRQHNGLVNRPQLMDYMNKVSLNEASLTTLVENVGTMHEVRDLAGSLVSAMLDLLRLDGLYLPLLASATEKVEMLGDPATYLQQSGLLPPQLLAWYFEQKLGQPMPEPLENHLTAIGLENRDDFYRIIAGDYLYWQLED